MLVFFVRPLVNLNLFYEYFQQEDDGNDDEMAAITARLQELPVDTKDWTLDEDLCDLLTMSSAAVRTEQQLTQIAHSVYERCLTNREFVNTGME